MHGQAPATCTECYTINLARIDIMQVMFEVAVNGSFLVFFSWEM